MRKDKGPYELSGKSIYQLVREVEAKALTKLFKRESWLF